MEIKGQKINSMFVERTEEGINLYGSCYEHKKCVVVRSTKNMENLAQQIYGEEYTNERFLEKLKDRPAHNFIGNLAGPISMPIGMDCVTFI